MFARGDYTWVFLVISIYSDGHRLLAFLCNMNSNVSHVACDTLFKTKTVKNVRHR